MPDTKGSIKQISPWLPSHISPSNSKVNRLYGDLLSYLYSIMATERGCQNRTSLSLSRAKERDQLQNNTIWRPKGDLLYLFISYRFQVFQTKTKPQEIITCIMSSFFHSFFFLRGMVFFFYFLLSHYKGVLFNLLCASIDKRFLLQQEYWQNLLILTCMFMFGRHCLSLF